MRCNSQLLIASFAGIHKQEQNMCYSHRSRSSSRQRSSTLTQWLNKNLWDRMVSENHLTPSPTTAYEPHEHPQCNCLNENLFITQFNRKVGLKRTKSGLLRNVVVVLLHLNSRHLIGARRKSDAIDTRRRWGLPQFKLICIVIVIVTMTQAQRISTTSVSQRKVQSLSIRGESASITTAAASLSWLQ